MTRVQRLPVQHALSFVLVLASTALAGDLNPPPGPMEPTMVSLDRLAPGECINDLPGDATALHVITQPGRYFLGADLSVPAGLSGIRVSLDPGVPAGIQNVAISLGGHAILGDPGSLHGVEVPPDASGRKIAFKVAIADAGDHIADMGGDGVHAEQVLECDVSGVRIEDCGGAGVHATGGAFAERRAMRIGSIAIFGQARMRRCGGAGGAPTVFADGFDDVEFDGLDVRDCAGDAVVVTNAERLDTSNLRLAECGLDGLHVEDTAECVLGAIDVSDCGGDGIEVLRAQRAWSSNKISTSLTTRVERCGGHAVLLTEVDDFELGGIDARDCAGAALHATASASARRKKARTTGNVIVDGGGTLNAAAVTLDGFDDVEVDGLEVSDYAAPALDVTTSSPALGKSARVVQVQVLPSSNPPVGPPPALTIDGFDDVEVTDLHVSNYPGPMFESTGTGSSSLRMKNQGKNVMGTDPLQGTTIVGHARVRLENLVVTNVASDAFTITGATDVVASGLSVTGCTGHALDIQCDSLELHECTTSGNTGDGMLIDARACSLSGCSSHDNGGDGLRTKSGTVLQFKKIQNSDFVGNAGAGVSLDVSGTLTLDGVDARGNTGAGVVVFSSSGVPALACDVTRCTFLANGGAGLSLSDVASGRITQCSAFSNTGTGIECLALSHVVTNNTSGNNGPGGSSNYSVLLPGNAVGSVVDESNIATTDNASNYAP